LDSEVLGLKWRAHPLALALAKVSLSTLEYRNEKAFKNMQIVFEALREIPGIEPVHFYPKAKPAGFYGGLKVIYHAEELGGLAATKFVEAMQAEGARISGPSVGHLEHLRTIFTQGFDLWGQGRGPLGKDFKPYKEGDFPVSEGLRDKVLTLPAYIEPQEGFLEEYIQVFRKVTSNYNRLL